jgi:acetoin utilization deacetylase AcuC-like enzyme
VPELADFRCDLLMLSAGFDAHADDPLASLRLSEEDFRWVTEELMKVAAWTCGGKVVSTLEGGYDLGALARSCAAHVSALMGR